MSVEQELSNVDMARETFGIMLNSFEMMMESFSTICQSGQLIKNPTDKDITVLESIDIHFFRIGERMERITDLLKRLPPGSSETEQKCAPPA